jgi:hypothetical protein
MATKKITAKAAPKKAPAPVAPDAPAGLDDFEGDVVYAEARLENGVLTLTDPTPDDDPVTQEILPTGGTRGKKFVVTAKREGFRRAGRAWSKTPVVVDASAFSPAQIAALKADPMLDVQAFEV